jgi:FkbH-like protein
MFELEVNHDRLPAAALPRDAITLFLENQHGIDGIALLPWEEHCTECAMPMCYTSCDLYESRKDGKCRRFIGGIGTLPGVGGIQGYMVRVSFKRWGQLLAYGNLHRLSPRSARRVERGIYVLDAMASRFPDHAVNILGRRSPSARLARRLKQSIASSGCFSHGTEELPDYLLIEVYNPGDQPVRLSLTVSNTDPQVYNAGYQQLLAVGAGTNSFRIDVGEIGRRLDLAQRFSVTLNPNILQKQDEGLSLYFGLLTFVWDRRNRRQPDSATAPVRHVKLLAWDLDNTLWDGILVEDGPDSLAVKQGIADIIRELDRRGILNTIVSKNNHDDAINFLERCGLKEYFLFSRIGWGQKGEYLRSIIGEFNFGADAVAFIDDSAFERDEVLSMNPGVRVYDAADYRNIPELPEFNPPASMESASRRMFYQTEKVRKDSLASFGGEYLLFLRDCNIRINVYRPGAESTERIHELVQRTNQLNFSGNRYQQKEIATIIADPGLDTCCIDCEDRYGQYGTIGFAIVDRSRSMLQDLMLSCRVQSKRVEHAFVGYLLTSYRQQGYTEFLADFRKTSRNEKAGAVFDDTGFVLLGESNGVLHYRFDLGREIPDDHVITVLRNGQVWTAAD